MPINSQIPLGVQPMQIHQQDPNSQMNALARVMQLQNAQQQNQLGQMQMDEHRRGIEDKTYLRNALSAPDADPYKVLLGRGMVKEANDFAKGQADVKKTQSDTEAKGVETAHKRVDSWGQAMGFVRQNPTPENAMAAVKHLVTMGVMPAEMAQSALSGVQNNPQSIQQWATQGFTAALQAKEQLPKFQTNNIGGQTVTQQMDPVTGRVLGQTALQNTQSPDNKASVGAQFAIAQSNRDAANINAQGVRDAAGIKDRRDTEMKLGDDYRTQSKGFKEVADAYRIISTSLDKATTSPAATLAGATKFMKLLDPGSVVRESELGMALAATGVLDRAANYYNTLKMGKVLTEKQAADFRSIAGQIYKAAQDGQKQVDGNYTRQAEQYGLRPNMIVQDLGQNTAAPVDLGSMPTGKPTAPKVVDFGSLK